MNEDEVIKIALDYAGRRGYAVERYEPAAKLDDGEWHVFFRGKDLLPGNFFSVYVDDASGTVKDLVPGK